MNVPQKNYSNIAKLHAGDAEPFTVSFFATSASGKLIGSPWLVVLSCAVHFSNKIIENYIALRIFTGPVSALVQILYLSR